MRLSLALLLLAGSSSAATVRLYGGPRSEDMLRRFVAQDGALKARLDEAVSRERAYVAEAMDSELRDSVAEPPTPERYKRMPERLPGMARVRSRACVTLSDCPTPDLALDVADSRALAESVRRLVRPWMLLQQARGKGLELRPVSAGDAVLTLRLKGSKAAPLTLNVSPRLLGGFKVWFEQPLVLAALYGSERDALLRAAR